ncbi:MAG: MarR family transcriptional regulator [Pseudomonadota bacterium]
MDTYLLYLMAQASAAVSQTFHDTLERQGIPVSKWRILASLFPDKKLNVGQLARRCLAKQPTLTRQLDKTCADGLTMRLTEDGDRRGVLICLTAEGRAVAADLVTKAREHEALVMADYSLEDVARLKETLIQLANRAQSTGTL